MKNPSERSVTQGIISKRTDYREADRILTFITPAGKLRGMVRGVRKPKSKLAGGLSLMAVCQLSVLQGRGELKQIISTRIAETFPRLTEDYDAMMVGYLLIELTDKVIEDEAESGYFDLLVEGLKALDAGMSSEVVELGFRLRLLKMLGHQPELEQDSDGDKLDASKTYTFVPQEGVLHLNEAGNFNADAIKAWRLLLNFPLIKTAKVKGLAEVAGQTLPVARALFAQLY